MITASGGNQGAVVILAFLAIGTYANVGKKVACMLLCLQELVFILLRRWVTILIVFYIIKIFKLCFKDIKR